MQELINQIEPIFRNIWVQISLLILFATFHGYAGAWLAVRMLFRPRQPVKILDLAEDMIRLSGLTPYEDIDIVFTGARKGEKLFEELEITGEDLLKTLHPKIFIGKIATYSGEEVMRILGQFQKAVESSDGSQVRRLFNEVLPEASITLDQLATSAPAASIEDSGPARPVQAKLGLAEK